MEEILKLGAGVLVLVVSAAILIFAVRAVWQNRKTPDGRAENRSALRDLVLEGMVYVLVLSAAAAYVLYRYSGGAQ